MLIYEKFRPERESNPDLWDSGAVLRQLGYQTNLELVFLWVYDKILKICVFIIIIIIIVIFFSFSGLSFASVQVVHNCKDH